MPWDEEPDWFGRPCAVMKLGAWGSEPGPCEHPESELTRIGPLPLCSFHARNIVIFPTMTGHPEKFARAWEKAFRHVPPEIEAHVINDGWTPRSLFRLWRSFAIKTQGRPGIPLAVKRAVYERDGTTCAWCGCDDSPTLDHIIPYSKGGPDTAENLRVLCRPCNSSRGAGRDHLREARAGLTRR